MFLLDDWSTICNNAKGVFSIIGIFVTIIKIFIPLALIVFGMLDMGKAVTNGDEKEIKKELVTFIRRAIAAIVVFFIPTIVGIVMQLVNNSLSDANACGYSECVSEVTGVSGKCNG